MLSHQTTQPLERVKMVMPQQANNSTCNSKALGKHTSQMSKIDSPRQSQATQLLPTYLAGFKKKPIRLN